MEPAVQRLGRRDGFRKKGKNVNFIGRFKNTITKKKKGSHGRENNERGGADRIRGNPRGQGGLRTRKAIKHQATVEKAAGNTARDSKSRWGSRVEDRVSRVTGSRTG